MITKKELEDLLQKTIEEGFQFAHDGFLDGELSSDDYAYILGKYLGRQEVLEEILKKFI